MLIRNKNLRDLIIIFSKLSSKNDDDFRKRLKKVYVRVSALPPMFAPFAITTLLYDIIDYMIHDWCLFLDFTAIHISMKYIHIHASPPHTLHTDPIHFVWHWRDVLESV